MTDITDEFAHDPPQRTDASGRVAYGLRHKRAIMVGNERSMARPRWRKELAGYRKAQTQRRNQER